MLYNVDMDPMVLQALNKMVGMAVMSEVTGPIDDAKFYWQIISHLSWPVILFLVLGFILPKAWPWITGKYRVRF